MIDINSITGTKYFASLNEEERTTLTKTFEAWPEELKEEFVKNILQMVKEDDPVQMLKELEQIMKDLKASAVVARHEEEKAQKSEEKDKAETLLGQY